MTIRYMLQREVKVHFGKLKMESEKPHVHKARGKVFPELRHRQLKEQAIAFYSEHKVQSALETLLNEMFLHAPVDVYGFMSEYFYGLALKPVISSLSAHEGLDSTGGKSLEVDLYCTINGIDKLVSSVSFSLDMYKNSEEVQAAPGKGQQKARRPSAKARRPSSKLQSPSTKTLRPPSTSQSPSGQPQSPSNKTRKTLGSSQSPSGGSSSPSVKVNVTSRSRASSLEQGELTSSYASTVSSTLTQMSAVTTITKYVVPALKGISPSAIDEVDTALATITSEDAQQSLHPSALLAASCSAVIAGAHFSDTPLFLHLSKTCLPPLPPLPVQITATPTKTPKKSRLKSSNPYKFTMPVPVVGALSGGQLGCGKCRFREFCLSPLPGAPFSEQIRMIVAVHSELENCLTAKFGTSGHGSLVSGAYCPPLDKPEQGLDLIRDAARNAGFELNQSMGVIVDVGADRLFDEEKGKYELITGQWKSSDDVINIYTDLLRSHPGLIGYVDPLHQSDVNGWKKLQERLGHNCLLIADQTLRKGLPIGEQKPEPVLEDHSTDTNSAPDVDKPSLSYLSCGTVCLEGTLSQTLTKASHIKGHSYYSMLKVPPHSTVNTLSADLAVAMQCRFLRMGAPNGLTSSGLLSRLIRIKEELLVRKMHDTAGAHVFTSTPKSVDAVCE